MKVVIDSRETDRIRPAMFYFSLNNSVSIEELDTEITSLRKMVKKQYSSTKQCQIS